MKKYWHYWLSLLAAALVVPALLSQTQIANNAAEIAGKIVMLADSGTARTVTGSFTFDRDPSAPFAVTSGSAVVSNLDADLLDGLTSARFNTTYVTTTATGTQNDFDPGLNASGGRTVIRANNASLLTITGFAAGAAVDGQQILVQAINGQVDFDHTPSASAAANELINNATSANTSITARGYALYVYDATTAMWRLASHEQGGWITPTFAAGNYAGNGAMTWTVGAGDVTTQAYMLRGRTLTVLVTLANTTVGGTPNSQLIIGNGAWGSFTATKTVDSSIVRSDNGTVNGAQMRVVAAGTQIVSSLYSGNWAASTDNSGLNGQIVFEVD